MKGAASPWSASDGQPERPQEVEQSPNGRYIRYNVLLGKGACKRVYKALDTEEGTEVAWNQVDLLGMDRDEEARQHLHEEIRVLQKLKHKNIMTFYAWWYDAKNSHINFITELFTAGNLRQYRKKIKLMSENVLKRWAHQILEGLLYLHGHVPPIVHRDLKCDNIFVNSATGEIKIGDLGLATVQQQAMSVVGTPEFMAPEVYDESYDERCDIYSFGMCLLELATQEYPYSECHSVPQIFKKVTLGIPPASLARVSSPELRDFISLCIAHNPADRPSARELLKHPYLDSVRSGTGLAGLDASGHGTGHASVLASFSGGSGAGTGWNTPSGTMHCAASARDLREALHQQEALARLAAAQQQAQLHQQQQSHPNALQVPLQPHLSCPSGASSPTAAAAAAAATAHSGAVSCSGAAVGADSLSASAGAVARSRASFTGMLGVPPPLSLLRTPSVAGSLSSLPSQPSPLGRNASPHSFGGELPAGPSQACEAAPSAAAPTGTLVGTVNAAAAAVLPPPPSGPPPRLPRSRLSGACDMGSNSGGSLPSSPMGRSQAPPAPAPWASGPLSAPSTAVPAGTAASLTAPGAAPCTTALAQHEEQHERLSGQHAPGMRAASPPKHQSPGGAASSANGPIGTAPPPQQPPDLLREHGRPAARSEGCSSGQHTSSGSRRSSAYSGASGGSDSDDDDEVLVPIEVLKAELLAEGFKEEEEEEQCDEAGPSFSQPFLGPGDDALRTPRLLACSNAAPDPPSEAGRLGLAPSLCPGARVESEPPLFEAPSFNAHLDRGRCAQSAARTDHLSARPVAEGPATESKQGHAPSPLVGIEGRAPSCQEARAGSNGPPSDATGRWTPPAAEELSADPAVGTAASASADEAAAAAAAVAMDLMALGDSSTSSAAAGGLARGSSDSATGHGHSSTGSLDALSFSAHQLPGASGAATPALRMSYSGAAHAQPEGPVPASPAAAAPGPTPIPQQPHSSTPPPARAGGRPPLPPASSVPPAPLPLPPVHLSHSTPQPRDGSVSGPAGGSGAAGGSVRLPSFRNKVVLTVSSTLHSPGAEGAGAAASSSAPQARCLRTTSAKALSLARRGGGDGPLFCSLKAPLGRAHAGWNGVKSFRDPRYLVATASVEGAGYAADACDGESGACALGRHLLPPQRQGRRGTADGEDAAEGGPGSAGGFVPPPYSRSMSQPITVMWGACSTDDEAGKCSRNSSLGGESMAAGKSVSETLPVCGAEALPADDSLPDGPQAQPTHGPPPEPAPRASACGKGNAADGGQVAAGWTSAAAPASGGPEAGSPPSERLGVHPLPPLPPLQEDSGELTSGSPRGSDSSGGGAAPGCIGTGAPAAEAFLGLDAVGGVTVVREYARPIQGIIMRLKQWKRLVKDRARALRA